MANVNFILLVTITFVALVANVMSWSGEQSSSKKYNCQFVKHPIENKYRCRACNECNRYVPNRCAKNSFCKMDRRYCLEILNNYQPTDKVTPLCTMAIIKDHLGPAAEDITMNEVCIDLEWNIELCGLEKISFANVEVNNCELILTFDNPDVSVMCVNITICHLANIKHLSW